MLGEESLSHSMSLCRAGLCLALPIVCMPFHADLLASCFQAIGKCFQAIL